MAKVGEAPVVKRTTPPGSSASAYEQQKKAQQYAGYTYPGSWSAKPQPVTAVAPSGAGFSMTQRVRQTVSREPTPGPLPISGAGFSMTQTATAPDPLDKWRQWAVDVPDYIERWTMMWARRNYRPVTIEKTTKAAYATPIKSDIKTPYTVSGAAGFDDWRTVGGGGTAPRLGGNALGLYNWKIGY